MGRRREENKTTCSQFPGALYDKGGNKKNACRAYWKEKKGGRTVKLLESSSSVTAYERDIIHFIFFLTFCSELLGLLHNIIMNTGPKLSDG